MLQQPPLCRKLAIGAQIAELQNLIERGVIYADQIRTVERLVTVPNAPTARAVPA